MDANLKRELILEHYSHPLHKGLIENESYIKINMNNESCIDEIDLMFLVEDHKIKDIRFDGEACAICTSSTSIMIETLLGKTIEEAKEIYQNYENMIEEKNFNGNLLSNAIVYEDISKQPNRKKCALLPWWGVRKLIKNIEK